jgi:hypothetical protein
MNALKTNITHDQRKKIFTLSRMAHLNNEELHFYLREWADVSSLSDGSCSNSQAHTIINSLENILNIRKVKVGESKGNITEKQVNAIKTIQRILKWHDGRISGFIAHTVGNDSIESLSVTDASKVITGLRNFLNKK